MNESLKKRTIIVRFFYAIIAEVDAIPLVLYP
jgi:hypothetical protein